MRTSYDNYASNKCGHMNELDIQYISKVNNVLYIFASIYVNIFKFSIVYAIEVIM